MRIIRTETLIDGLTFGAGAPLLKDQFKERGAKAPAAMIAEWQKDADAIVRLAARGILPAGEVEKAETRIIRSILKNIPNEI